MHGPKFDGENCGEIGTDGVRQAVRDEVCLYAVNAMRSQMSGYPFEQPGVVVLGEEICSADPAGLRISKDNYDAVLLTTDCTTIFGLLCAPYG